MANVDTCVMCGAVVPEGTMVCPVCSEKEANLTTETFILLSNNGDNIDKIIDALGLDLKWYQKILLRRLWKNRGNTREEKES